MPLVKCDFHFDSITAVTTTTATIAPLVIDTAILSTTQYYTNNTYKNNNKLQKKKTLNCAKSSHLSPKINSNLLPAYDSGDVRARKDFALFKTTIKQDLVFVNLRTLTTRDTLKLTLICEQRTVVKVKVLKQKIKKFTCKHRNGFMGLSLKDLHLCCT